MKFRLIIDREKEEEVVVTAREPSALTEGIRQLVLQESGMDRIPGYTEDDVKLLRFADIECITILNGKTYAIDIHNHRYRLKQRLYELEKILPPSFIRINKSSLANQERLERFTASFSGAVDAVFQCGYTEYVSRRCFAQIKRRLETK